MLPPGISDVIHVGGHVLWVKFDDGVEGEVDLVQELEGPIFEPLLDTVYFGQVRIHPELGVLTWPNEADIAPERLYALVRSVA